MTLFWRIILHFRFVILLVVLRFLHACVVLFYLCMVSLSLDDDAHLVALVFPLPNPGDPRQHEACCPLCKPV